MPPRPYAAAPLTVALPVAACASASLRPALPLPGGGFPPTGARSSRLQPAPWPAITQPGHADRRAALERDTLPDVLLAVHQRAWPLSLGWPGRAGWCQGQAVLTQMQPVIGGWWLQWADGALLLPDELVVRVWRLARQRRDGLDQHLMVSDGLGRPVLLLGMAAPPGALHCGWHCLLDELAPWPPG